jgi:hypothetical protein
MKMAHSGHVAPMACGLALGLALLGVARPLVAQGPPNPGTIGQCLATSVAAGIGGALLGALGIPEMNLQAPVMYGLKIGQACAMNAKVATRNTRYQATLKQEVAQYKKLERLFRETELVIGFGDAPGTEVQLGGNGLAFLELVPAAMTANWTRHLSTTSTTTATGAETTAPRSERVLNALTAAPRLRTLFQDPSATSATREAQSYADGSQLAFEAALTAEDNATDLTMLADSLEAQVRRAPPGSGRARQLRALGLVRIALASNQRLRTEAAMLRSAADIAAAGLTGTLMDRVATFSSGRITP